MVGFLIVVGSVCLFWVVGRCAMYLCGFLVWWVCVFALTSLGWWVLLSWLGRVLFVVGYVSLGCCFIAAWRFG